MEKQAESKVIVAVRVRPLSEDEQERSEESIVYCPEEHTLLVSQEGIVEKAFSFNMVFGPESSQQEIFDSTGMRRLIDMATKGYSCTVFAFGQTGSGKTYTITGPHSLFSVDSEERELEGLMQRSVAYLLHQVHSSDEAFQLCASYAEIYNEQVRDLLNPWVTYSLAVRGSRTTGFYVENLSVVEFCNLEGFMTLLERGMQNRQTSSQTQNEHSSRSHSILTLYIKHTSTGAEPAVVTQGKLCIVDLAGSERVKDGDSTEKLLEETGNINRSLLTLGKCITALVDPKKRNGHIPYRDSKLTMLLSDSLGGEGITLMIACVSSTSDNLQETMNTLRYSSKAKRIKNKPMAKNDLREQILAILQKEIRNLKEENMILRQHLPNFQSVLEPGASVSNTGSTASNESTEPISSYGRSDSIGSDTSLRTFLQDLMKEIDQLQRDKRVLLDKQESSDQQRERLSQENIRLLRKLRDLERVICSSPHSSSSYSGMSVDDGSSGCSPQWSQNPIQPLLHLPTEHSSSYPHCPIMYCCTCSLESHQKGQICPQLFERLALHEDSYGVHCHSNPQVEKLPPIQVSDAPRHPIVVEGGSQTGREIPGEEPVSGACPPRRRRSQLEKRGYAERFQDLLESRAQKAQSAEVTTGRPQQGTPGLPLLSKKGSDSS